MNLTEIIAMAGSILDYSPDVPTYRAELRRFVNEAYRELFALREWTFGQKEVLIEIEPDLTVTGLSIVRPAGHRTLQLQDPSARGLLPVWVSGAIVEITAATGTVSIPQEVQCRAWVDTDTIILEDQNGADLASTFGTATAVSVTIKQRYIDLPPDCQDILGLQLRYPNDQRSPYLNLTRWEDEHWLLDINLTGRPTNFILHDPARVDAPVVQPSCVNSGASANAVPAAGSYDVLYTHMVGHRESGPSPQSDLTTFAAGEGLNISGMQNNGLDDDTAYRKKVYFRAPASEAFYEVDDPTVAESVTTLPGDAAIDVGFVRTSRRLQAHAGVYPRIRMYPRQDAQQKITLRYMATPPPLLDNADVPVFPAEGHKYLVHKACAELFVKHGNAPLAQLYAGRAEQDLSRLARRYLTTKSQLLVKGNFRGSQRSGRPWLTLTHTP